MPPRPPPCEQYGTNFKLMRPKWRPYCREKIQSKTLKKEKQPRKKSRKSSSSTVKKCQSESKNILNNFKTLLNLDVNASDSEICDSLKKATRKGVTPSEDQIRLAGYAMGIYGKEKKSSEILQMIEKKIEKDLTPPFRRMIRLSQADNKFTGEQLVMLVCHIVRPDGFPDKNPQPLSDKEFEELVKVKRNAAKGEYLARDKEALLEQSLVSKLCHCIKSQFLVHKFRYEALHKHPEGPNPYALCQSRTFNKRGLKGIGLRSGVCEKRFDWFRRLDKVTGKRIPAFPAYKPQPVKTDKKIMN